jgi:hypothetical protein
MSGQRPGSGSWVSLLVDIVVPVGLYYGLRAAGVGIYLALVASAVVPAGVAVVRLVRQRRVDGLAVYVLTILVLSALVSLVTGNPRALLAREGWLIGITGLWFVCSVFARRPLAYLYTRPMLERSGRVGPAGMSWEDLWERLPGFRRIWRVSSVLWGVGLLADAALRVLMAYNLPVDEVPGLGTGLYVVTSVVLIVVTNVYYALSGLYNARSGLYAPLAPVSAPAV